MKNTIEIKIKNLNKSFGNKAVLKDLSVNIAPSESVVILGQSGMGKSVFLQILGLLSEATSGSIKYNDTEMVKLPEMQRGGMITKIGFLFQNCGLFDDISVLENVCFFDLFIKKNKNKAFVKNLAKEKLKLLKIDESAFNIPPSKISGGMQKRVAMARILMSDPALILLDEPTSGLDPIMSEIINTTINDIRAITDATIVTITHDLHSALSIADKICVLKDGQFIWQGNSNDITHCTDEYIKKFIESSNVKL